MTEIPSQAEVEEDSQAVEQTFTDRLKRQSDIGSSLGRSLSENYPSLIDKLISPKILPSSQYHALIPNINFGNLSDSKAEVMSLIEPEILFNYAYWAEMGWVTPDLANNESAKWTVILEQSKAVGSERLAKLFFTEIGSLTVKKDNKNKPFSNESR